MNFKYYIYRLKYRYGKYFNLTVPVDVSLELSSFCDASCTYCLDPNTPVLIHDFTWKAIKDLKEGDEIIGFDEETSGGQHNKRKIRKSIVEKVWWTEKDAYEIETENRKIIASLDHKFLEKGSRWRDVKRFKVGQQIKASSSIWEKPDIDSIDYMRGYLKGITEGDGTARWEALEGATGNPNDSRRQVWWRIALVDKEPLDRIEKYLKKLEIKYPERRGFNKSNPEYKDIEKLEIRSKESLKKLKDFIYSDYSNEDDYKKGFIAGFFDAEGSCSKVAALRISQIKENGLISKSVEILSSYGFDSVIEDRGLRLRGNCWEKMRFHGMFGTAIERKKDFWTKIPVDHKNETIKKITYLGKRKLVDIQTSTKTFYAQGMPTHNCYHNDKKNLPFPQKHMSYELAQKVLYEAADLGVSSIKTNFRGESTLNPRFHDITRLTKNLGFIDRITNSNFNFHSNRDDIFLGLSYQTKVKVSFDSFNKDVFEKHRIGEDYDRVIRNINHFYNLPNRHNEIIIQAVRSDLNKNEDFENEVKRRWPSAKVSIRDMVTGRIDKDLSEMVHKERQKERVPCNQAFVRLIVLSDGKIAPCCPAYKGDLLIGDATKQTLHEVFNSKKAKTLRGLLKNGHAFEIFNSCKNCSSFESYKGHKIPWNS